MGDVNDGGVAGKNHGGPGWDDREHFMPLNSTVGDAHDDQREADRRTEMLDED